MSAFHGGPYATAYGFDPISRNQTPSISHQAVKTRLFGYMRQPSSNRRDRKWIALKKESLLEIILVRLVIRGDLVVLVSSPKDTCFCEVTLITANAYVFHIVENF